MPDLITGLLLACVLGAIAWFSKWGHAWRRRLKHESSSASKTDLMLRIIERKYMRVGIFNYPPFVILGIADKAPTGYYVRAIMQLASQKGLEIHWKRIKLSKAVSEIESGSVDMVISIFETPKRCKGKVEFAGRLHSVAVAALVHKKSKPLTSFLDLEESDQKVAVGKDEVAHEILQEMKVDDDRIHVLDTGDLKAIGGLVESGECDVALVDGVSCLNYLASRSHERGLKLIMSKNAVPPVYPNGTMIPEGQPALKKWLDDGLKEVRRAPDFRVAESEILKDYGAILSRL